ncbi:BGTF surface domain-containing protein [Halomicrobium katesii]|uniref:BGTF surface domain-containing protein n=1 Tax=Halomicrobium katesii TaxID=437163 RepID=UPI00037A074D|nr:BGTF surface domain-containing protein [Halomicrobium katesii]
MRQQTVPAIVALLLLVPCAAIVALLLLVPCAAIGAQTTPTATIDSEGEELTVEAAPGEQLSGETTLPPGTRLTVRIESTTSAAPFLKRLEATVADDGTFTATGDLSDLPPDTAFEATVVYNATVIGRQSGQIVPCTSDCTATPRHSDTATAFPTDEPALPRPVVQVREGGTVEIPIAVGDREHVRLSIGSDRTNYRLNATVTDGDGDGRAVVSFDTASAGRDAPTLSPVDDDRVTTDSETALSDGLDPTEYDLTLLGASGNGTKLSIGTLVVFDQSETRDAPEPPEATTSTPPLNETTPATDRGVDLGGIGALTVGGLLGIVGIALLLGVARGGRGE